METILVVEDDLAVQKALRRLFESEDYAVEVKPDGQAGLDAFHSSRPAAVVLDLRLPGLPPSAWERPFQAAAQRLDEMTKPWAELYHSGGFIAVRDN